MQVRIANRRAGGSASSPLAPNDSAYSAFALEHLSENLGHADLLMSNISDTY